MKPTTQKMLLLVLEELGVCCNSAPQAEADQQKDIKVKHPVLKIVVTLQIS